MNRLSSWPIAATVALAACSGGNDGNAQAAATIPNQLMAANDLASGTPTNQMASPGAAPAAPMPIRATDYLKVAGADDLYERQSAGVALNTSQNPEVRAFAQRMVADHTRTSEALKAAGANAGIAAPPPQLMPAQQQHIAELRAKTGSAFDQLYLDQQLAAHRAALALHQTYARSGDTPALKKAASGVVPIIRAHLDRVQQLLR